MLVPLYGDEIPCLMYASKWKQREQGVTQFSAGMRDAVTKANEVLEDSATLSKEQRANQALLLNMTEVLKDKVQQIVNKCLPMVEKYIQILREMPQLNPKQDTSIFERFLMQILEKMPDAKYQKQTVRVYNVSPFGVEAAGVDGDTDMMMVEVIITFQGPDDGSPAEITRMSWIAPN